MEQISETLWKFMEKGILADENRHDALVYFGRRTSRSTLIEKVHLWGRVLKGMGKSRCAGFHGGPKPRRLRV